jgi:signal transduction histidine kinase
MSAETLPRRSYAPPRARVTLPRVTMKKPSLVAWMVLALGIVGAIAFWNEERESAATLDDFAQEQTLLAQAVGASLPLEQSTAHGATDGVGPPPSLFFARARAVELPGLLRVLVARPGEEGLLATDGTRLRSPTIERALAAHAKSVRLTRTEASTLGLPARTALAGLMSIDASAPPGAWGVVVVASAQRERDRQLRAKWRLVLSVSLAAGLVLVFGGLALRTQRKELELARELAIAELAKEGDERLVRADKLATMGALATGIAHEVSTPLGVIAGRAEQLASRVRDDEKARRSVQVIAEQAERIDHIIRGFLSLARGNAAKLERVQPASIVRSALELVEHRFAKAEVALVNDVAKDLPRIACEPRLFEQVLVNLLLNACDACSAGGTVELSVRGDAERVAFVVTDDGAGISEAAALRATEPFFTTKPEGEGTGLGLAIANEIVKHHGGSLTISPRSVGTRACVEVPAARAHDV